QFAGPLGFMIVAIAVAELGNVRIDQPRLAVANFGIALRNRTLAETQALHFGAAQRDPGLEHILDVIVETSAAVLRNGLYLVESRSLGTCHDAGHLGAGGAIANVGL